MPTDATPNPTKSKPGLSNTGKTMSSKKTPAKPAAKKSAAQVKQSAVEDKMSHDYGYALAFMKSDPALYKIFQAATSGPTAPWDVAKFQATVKGSSWYQKHGEAWRTNMALKTTDPETWRQNQGRMHQQVRARTAELQTQLDPGSMNRISEDAMNFGWDQSQIDAAIKNQKFWKTNSESSRQYEFAKASDPKTFAANQAKARVGVRDAANGLNAPLDVSTVARIADQAMRGGWDTAQISDAIRSEPGFKGTSESQRTDATQALIDPETRKANLAKATSSVEAAANAMGAQLTPEELASLGDSALKFGWSQQQLTDELATHVKTNEDGAYTGTSEDAYQALANTSWRNGVKVPDETMQTYVSGIAAGTQTVAGVQALLRKQAASLAPGYADELNSGMDLHDIAQPYMQSMASTLEMSPTDINLFDPTIMSALGARNAEGKPASKTLWEFNQDLRKDTRWRKTQGAQNETFAVANKVLSDFGLGG